MSRLPLEVHDVAIAAELIEEGVIPEVPKRKAQLVMGEPLGLAAPRLDGNGLPLESDSNSPNEDIPNKEILVDLPDNSTDLELTHLRLKTLRGLSLHRFKNVERISLRQNLLSSLSYTPSLPPPIGHTLSEPSSSSTTTTAASGSTLPIITSLASAATASSTSPSPSIHLHPDADVVDEDPNDDEDAVKKESEFEYHDAHDHSHAAGGPGGEEEGERQWPLRNLKLLEEIDLYDNRLKSVRGLEGLDNLTSLDLSFNLLRSISPLVDESEDSLFAYPLLTHLYLIQNKLSVIEGVKHRDSLVYLEFGGNRIRTIENLPQSANLKSLFLGKNKITKIEGLDGLTGLTTLSIQSNRITKIEGLEKLTELSELYLSHNGLTKIEGLKYNTKLTTLDVGNNKIDEVDVVEEMSSLVLLEEFWANDNALTSLPLLPPSSHPNLQTIYLEHNPIMVSLAGNYRRKVMLEMPQLHQIDAGFVGKRAL